MDGGLLHEEIVSVAGGKERGMDLLQRKMERKNLEMMRHSLVG